MTVIAGIMLAAAGKEPELFYQLWRLLPFCRWRYYL